MGERGGGSSGGRGKGRTGPVTAVAVIDAALVVIDDDGLDALTMRRLAHDLGVEPVTIYRQLPNKDAILAGVAEKLWREMAPPEGAPSSPPAQADWREQVRGMWLALNGLMQAAPQRDPHHRARRRRTHRAPGRAPSACWASSATRGSRPTRRRSCCTSSRPAWSASGSRRCGAVRRAGRPGGGGRGGRASRRLRSRTLGDLDGVRGGHRTLGPGAVRHRRGHRARCLRRGRA